MKALMTHQFRLAQVAAALLGLSLSLAGHSAHAASGIKVGASVSNSSLTVIDLTPDDGKAAGYATFSGRNSRLDSNIYSAVASWTQREAAYNYTFEPLAATVAYAGSSSISSSPQWGELRTETQLLDTIGDRGNAGGNLLQSLAFVIAPHTQLVYSAHNELSISDVGPDSPFLGEAVTTVRFGDASWARGMMQGSMGYHDSGVRGEDFSLSVYNHGDTEQYVYLFVDILSRTAYYAPSPVPEPATYAMFGLGALMVGALSRRKRRQASAA
jgi:hypothetical protein